MSKKKQASTLSYTPQTPVPAIGAYKIEWSLNSLFYKGVKDQRIEQDLRKTERAIDAFAKKYRSGSWKNSIPGIVKAVDEFLSLISLPGSVPLYYLSYRRELNARDTEAEKLLNIFESRLTRAQNQILFFELSLASIPKTKQKQLLRDSRSEPYRFYLQSLFNEQKFQLTEPEEKILNLKANTARHLWVSATEKILNKKTIRWKGSEISVNGALMEFENLPQAEGRKMYDRLVPHLKDVGEFAESELTALVLDKQTNDELRGYEKPYSATTQAFDSNDTTLENLVSVIEDEGYTLAHRFFKLKKKLANRELHYIDRNIPLKSTQKVTFNDAVEICRGVFYDFDKRYGQIFDRMIKNGCIDVWPKTGKGGGAFCSSGVNSPTLVLLNHNDSIESLRTLAHEMGHAVHAERSKTQPAWYQGHSILTAETASTFFESLVLESLVANVDGKEKANLLHSMIADKIMTMILCIARFNFELEMHTTIRTEGAMTADEMARGLTKHFKRSVGPAVKMVGDEGWIVVSKPHYRMNFYQYSYSFGEIGSSIMRNRYHSDQTYQKEIDAFLSAGCSDSVENIFKSIGIDMASPDTYREGLALLRRDIDELEKLTR